MCEPEKYIADFVISPFPMVDAHVTQQLNVPGFNDSNSFFARVDNYRRNLFPGPASCP